MVNEGSKQPGKRLWLCPGFKPITIGCYIAPKFYIPNFDMCGVSYTSLSALTSKGWIENSALGKGQKSCQDAQTWLCITIKKGSVASEYKTEFKFNKFSNNWVKLTSISSWVVKSSVLQERLYYVPWFLIFHSELAAALPTSLFFLSEAIPNMANDVSNGSTNDVRNHFKTM